MNYCKQCGAELAPNAGFCTQCGARVEADTSPPSVPEVTESLDMATPPGQVFPEPVPEVQEAAPMAPPPVGVPVYAYAPPPAPAPAQAGGQVPPAYGYGAVPPQAPQAYPYGAPGPTPSGGTYPGGPQGPYPPGYAYPAQAPAPKRKKRWWIPVIIVALVLGLLAGSWIIFGDQIKGLFGSTEKKWKKAEAASNLIPEGSFLGDIRQSVEEGLHETKSGSVTDLTFDVKADSLPDEVAEILTALSSVRLHLEAKSDMDEKAPRFHITAGIGKRGETGELLSAEIYDVEDYYIIGLPEILSRPLALKYELMEDLTGSDDLSLDQLFASTGDLRKSLADFSDEKLDQIWEDLKAIFMKYADEPELVKGDPLTVGTVTQKLNYYDVTVSATAFPGMAKEMLTYLKNSADIKKLLDQDFLEDGYEGFVESIDELLDDLDRNRGDVQTEIRRKLYVDKKNNPQGSEILISSREDGELNTMRLASLQVEDGGKYAQILVMETGDDFGLEYLSEYSLNKGRYTGKYTIRAKERDYWNWDKPAQFEELGRGTFTDFGFQKEGKVQYPVGSLSFDLTRVDEDDYDAPQALSLKYEGKVEGGRLKAKLEIALTTEDLPLVLTLGIEHKSLSASEISFHNELPSNFIDLSDEDAMEELVMDDSIMEKVMGILEELGIDPSIFGGGGYEDDWDDDWDWD